MLEITGEKFFFSGGVMVVCDPECIENILAHSIRVGVGTQVTFEGKEYTVRGVQGPTPKLDRWGLFLKAD